MTCTNCGSDLMRPSTFCSNCGQLITQAANLPAWPPGTVADRYPPSDDDTAEFPAIPAYAMTAYDPAPGYSPPPSPPPHYGPPVSPAIGYNVPVSPYLGYVAPVSPEPVPSYAHQAVYTQEQSYQTQQTAYAEQVYTQQVYPSYAETYPNDGYGAPGQPYAGAPAAYDPYDQVLVEAEPPPLPPDDPAPAVYGTATQPPDNRLSNTAFVLAGLAVLVLPFIFGLAAIVVSNNAAKQGERLAPLAFKASLAGTAIGCILSGVVLWVL